jgi:aryl-alcohol dehydrogenase-like predicted oxidoreductase
MERRKLGSSDLEVGILGLGCNNFGMKIDLAASRAVIDAALDAGIDLLDTADLYGGCKSEEFIGQALEGRRERVVLATKFGGLAYAQGAKEAWGTRAYVARCVEDSLRRLRTDRIDLYQMHYPDPRTPIEETLAALDGLVRAGKVRWIGCSNFSGEQIDAAASGARAGTSRIVSAQNEWSLLQRDAEAGVVPACLRHGIGVLPYFPLASGVLTGKYRRGQGFGEGTRLATMDYFKSFGSDANLARAESLAAFARGRGRSLLELALGWLASQGCVASVIAGATTPDQVRANAAASGWRLTADEVAGVDRVLGNQV